jgi:nitrite reductase/ring-hydroxylating ferredoxin subunit
MARRKIRVKIFENQEELENNVPLKRANSMRVRGKNICLARSAEGIFAVQDKCPHNGASLSHGWVSDRNSIVCPLHRYDFDLKTGRGLSGIADCLETYPIIITDKGVFLEIEEGFSFWS